MDIQNILSKIQLTDEQKAQISKLGNPEDIKKFLSEHHIEIPENMQGLVSGVVAKASTMPADAGNAVKGILDNTDIDEKIMGGIKNIGKKKDEPKTE